MGSKRQAGQPLSRRASFLIQLGFIALLAFVPTCGTVAVLPVGSRVAALLVCPSDTDHSVVMTRWGGTSKGGRSLKSELYCVTAEGFGTMPSTAKVMLALLVIYGGLAGVLLLLLRLPGLFKSRGSSNAA
jgi:hypothetical protein